MDGYVGLLFDCEAIACLAAFIAGAMVQWSFAKLIFSLFGLALAGVAFDLAVVIGAPIEVVPELAVLTALALLPVIFVATVAGRATRKFMKRITEWLV